MPPVSFPGTISASEFTDLAEAVAYIGAAQAYLILPLGQTFGMSANLTIPENITLVPLGGVIQLGGYALTIHTLADAGPGQIFDVSGGGTVSLPNFSGVMHAGAFGARGDGATDDGPAINAALSAVASGHGGVVRLRPATYLTGETLLVGSHVTLEGVRGGRGSLGRSTWIVADGISGAVVQAGLGGPDQSQQIFRRSAIRDLAVGGTCTIAVHVWGTTQALAEGLYIRTDSAVGCLFRYTYGSTFRDIEVDADAGITEASFVCADNFNANACNNWYTVGGAPQYNFVVDNAYNGHAGGGSHGNTFTSLTAQSGQTGLFVGRHSGSTFAGFYTEAVGLPVKLGDRDTTRQAIAITFTGGRLSGWATDGQAGKRTELIELSHVVGGGFYGVNLALEARLNSTEAVISGDGSGALCLPLVDGVTKEVKAVAVVDGGSGYSSATGTITASDGSGATCTVTVSDGRVTGVTVTNPGSGYQDDFDGPTLVCTMDAVSDFVFSGCYANVRSTPSPPWHPDYPVIWPYMLVRKDSGARPRVSIRITGTYTIDAANSRAVMAEVMPGAADNQYVVSSRDDVGAEVVHLVAPAVWS